MGELALLVAFALAIMAGVVFLVLPWYEKLFGKEHPSPQEIEAAEQEEVPAATIIRVHHFKPGYTRITLLTPFNGSVECVTRHDPAKPIEFGMSITHAKLARIGTLRRSEYDWWLYGWETLR